MLEYNSKEYNEEILKVVTTKVDKKLVEKFGQSFNKLVDRALRSYEKSTIDYDLFTMNKDVLNNILETAQILRDETSEERIKQEYKKHQARYLYDSIKEYSMLN